MLGGHLFQGRKGVFWMLLQVPSLVFFLSLGIQPTSAAYSVTIKPGDEECFSFRTPQDSSMIITGSFDCLDDDAEGKDLSVLVTDSENGEILYKAPRGIKEGMFKLAEDRVKPNRKYSLCFENNESKQDEAEPGDNALDVGFSIHANTLPRTLKQGEIGPDAERALKLVHKAMAIQQDWTSLLDHYEFMKNREAIHQEMSDAILRRLSRWTYLEILLVIGMATGQVMYWKKFFETRRYL